MEANKVTLKTLAVSIAAIFALEAFFKWTMTGQTAFQIPALGILRCAQTLLLLFISFRLEKNTNSIGLSRSKLLAGLGAVDSLKRFVIAFPVFDGMRFAHIGIHKRPKFAVNAVESDTVSHLDAEEPEYHKQCARQQHA